MTLITHPEMKSFRFDAASKTLSLAPKDETFYRNPYLAYETLHPFGPYFYWSDYGFLCASGYNEVNSLLRDKRFGRVPIPHDPPLRPELVDFDAVEKNSLLELEPPEHTLLRKRINRAFVSRQIETLRPSIEAYAHHLIDKIDISQPFDLIKQFSMPLPVRVIATMLGIPHEMEPALLAWSHAIVKVYTRTQSIEETAAANRAAAEFTAFMADMIREKRQNPKDDLLSLLCTDGREALSDEEITSTAILLLNAGHEATVHQTGNCVALLLQENAWNKDYLGDDARIASTLEEAIRLRAPLHMFARIAHEDVALNHDILLRKGETIGLLLGAANCCPIGFSRSQQFWPERPDQRNVTFGAGIHFCIGAPLARLEMQIALKVLFARMPELAIAATPNRANSYHFYGYEQLLLDIP